MVVQVQGFLHHEDKLMKITKKIKRVVTISLFILMIPLAAGAHVGYLVSDEKMMSLTGHQAEILFAPLLQPMNLFLIALTLFLVVGLVAKLHKAPFIKRIKNNLEVKEVDYQRIFPWLIRMSLGVALIGAGSSGSIISPILGGHPEFAVFQMVLGFLLLTGFLLELAIVLTALLYVYAVIQAPYMLGNLDFFALTMAFLLIGEDRPGLDDLLDIPCYCFLKKMNDFLPLLLRVGIGFSMAYLAIYEKFVMPAASLQVVNDFGLTFLVPVSAEMWVLSAGIIELVIAIALFIGFYTRLTTAIAFIVLSFSFFFFGENVHSHVTLFATLAILFVTGGNRWSLDYHLEHHWGKNKRKKIKKGKVKKKK
jgi:uncharacterized membrane protein YphA (DoxX/SURF4 family)